MSWDRRKESGSSSTGTDTSSTYSYFDVMQKPLEMYVFVDPICPECWSLEPYLKKLSLEYGRFFTFRPVISNYLKPCHKGKFATPRKLKEIWEKTATRTGMSCDGDIWLENPISSPLVASIAIKAAELQGKKAGRLYLRKLQENLFLNKQDVTNEHVLMQCAHEANLDLHEFQNDLISPTAKKALQADIKLTKEMEVDYIPTIVFFNQRLDEQGIKISGLYPYDIYVRVLCEVLQKNPIPSQKPSLEEFLKFYKVVASKEISVVYDWSIAKTEKEMKKLQLRQLVEKIPAKHGTFWKYLA
ncbi:ClpXP adapter SpxH family protein [Virgibacillus sp. 179-BFC.A HS]|uniref:ClpXP adapter protein SpxH n=1 Tax=Tigheibacillus jepli TaxID=3035914 RepID=A0ABU5CIM2_9BACI|nr:ClpXP adapter SpxH family protein [Virgibacillus sp. 179-BFC.A HS]MDY0406170.1 ClpXP adapter SpxH family protein [Virgibacillus sp. 179-BFC.A HS]